VLTTIRSRTHHYPFRLIPPGVMRGLLSSICTAEGIAVEPTVLPLVVRAGGGSARDALSVLDQLIAGSGPDGVTYAHAIGLLGVTDGALLDEMVDALAAGDSAAVYETVDRVVEAGHDPRRFATDLLERLRDLVVLDAVPDANAKGLIDYPPDEVERMTDQSARLGTATLSRMADIVHTGLIEMRGTTSPRLLLELVSARMLLPSAAADGGALLQRLERMERRLSVSGGAVEPAPAVRDAPVREAAVREAAVREAAVREAPVREAPVRDAPAGEAPAPETAKATPAARSRRSRPDQPEPAAAAPPPYTPVGELDAAAVRRIWPEVLDNVKRRRRTAHALLMNVSVQSVDDGVLTLTISSIPLSRLLAQDANTEVVRSALKDVLGVDWRIAVVVDGDGGPVGGGNPGGASGGTAPPLPDDDPRDDEPSSPTADGPPARVDPEEAAISLLQSTLGAKRMDG
jgi:DNA polymerase III subunit gamma/tau